MTKLPNPTPALIAKHLREYDRAPDGGVPDKAVRSVFGSFPRNDDPGHVLAKVAVLNAIYFTNILAIRDVADSIVGRRIDKLLKQGAPEVLTALAVHRIGGRMKNHFSFATKYAHWHQPDSFPIFDSFVHRQLLAYRRRDGFATFHPLELRTPQFVCIFDQFRRFYGLDGCSLRAIDKWLWRQGKALWPRA